MLRLNHRTLSFLSAKYTHTQLHTHMHGIKLAPMVADIRIMGSGCLSSIPPPPFTSHETLGSYFIFPWLIFLILQKAGFPTVLEIKLMFCTSTAQKLINLQLHGFLICSDTSKVLRGTLVMCSHVHMFCQLAKVRYFDHSWLGVLAFSS